MTNDLERVCYNCQAAFPADPFQSEYAICLNAPEFEPYLDDILERQDFSQCQELVLRSRFAWDSEACDDFDPVDDEALELSPEFTAKVERLVDEGRLSAETLREAILDDRPNRTDWSRVPVDEYERELQLAKSLDARMEAVNPFGFFIRQGNKAAFDVLCEYLRTLPAARSVDDKVLRIAILRELATTREYRRELALLLVADLFRAVSNNATRGWYSEVFRFFESSCPPEVAEEALRPMLDSSHFSYRVKKRVQAILDDSSNRGQYL